MRNSNRSSRGALQVIARAPLDPKDAGAKAKAPEIGVLPNGLPWSVGCVTLTIGVGRETDKCEALQQADALLARRRGLRNSPLGCANPGFCVNSCGDHGLFR